MVWVDVEIIAGPNHLVGKSASIQLKETNGGTWDRDIGRVEILRMFGEFDDLSRISRSHFSISYNIEDAMIVRDAGSSNGTKMLDGVYDGPDPINIELSGFLHLRLSFSNQEYSYSVDGIVPDGRNIESGHGIEKQLSDQEFFQYITSSVEVLCNHFALEYQIGRKRSGGWHRGIHPTDFEQSLEITQSQTINNYVWKIILDDRNLISWEHHYHLSPYDHFVKMTGKKGSSAIWQHPLSDKNHFEGKYYLLSVHEGKIALQHSGYYAGNFDYVSATDHYATLDFGTPRLNHGKLVTKSVDNSCISLVTWLSSMVEKYPPNLFCIT